MKILTSIVFSMALAGATLVPTSAFAADSCGPPFCSYVDPGIKNLVQQLGLTLTNAPVGVQVTLINNPAGLGASNGLKVGDRLQSANATPVNNLQDLINIIADAKIRFGGQVNLTVVSGVDIFHFITIFV